MSTCPDPADVRDKAYAAGYADGTDTGPSDVPNPYRAQPLDLDDIEARANAAIGDLKDFGAAFIDQARCDIHALIAEVKRLRGEVVRLAGEKAELRVGVMADPHNCLPSLGYPCGDCHRCRPQPDPLDENDHRAVRTEEGYWVWPDLAAEPGDE